MALPEKDVPAFMEACRESKERLDIEAALSFYRTPLAIATRERGWIVATEDELRAELSQMFDFYRYNGLARLELDGFETRGEETAVTLAILAWRALDASGGEIARFELTYALAVADGERRITGVIVHNETLPRDALSAEALQAIRSRP